MIYMINEGNSLLDKFIFDNRFVNPYLYIDYNYLWKKNTNCDVWVIEKDNNIVGVILKYCNTLQMIGSCKIDSKEISDFVDNNQFKMITGPSLVIDLIKSNKYKKTEGYIMKVDETISIEKHLFNQVEFDDFKEIAELICSDLEIGGHYNVDELESQLKNRFLNENCRNFVYKLNGEIVSHCATYAECADFAIIGGVITKDNYRGKGYAKNGVVELVNELIKDNKLPLLYVYKNNVKKWYELIGFKKIINCSKLELK